MSISTKLGNFHYVEFPKLTFGHSDIEATLADKFVVDSIDFENKTAVVSGVQIDFKDASDQGTIYHKGRIEDPSLGSCHSFIETILTKFIALLLQQRTLSMEIDGVKSNDAYKKAQLRQEKSHLDSLIEELGKIKLIASHVITKWVLISNSGVIRVNTGSPYGLLIEGATQSAAALPADFDWYFDFQGSDLPEDKINEIREQVGGMTSKFSFPTQFSITYDGNPLNVSISKNLMTYLVTNRHLLSTCSDIMFNLLFDQHNFSANQFLNRGAVLRKSLSDLSVRYPFLDSKTFKKRDIITTVSKLYKSIYNDTPNVDYRIDDVDEIKIDVRKGYFATHPNTITGTALLSLMSKMRSTYVEYEENYVCIKLDDDNYIGFEVSVAPALTQLTRDQAQKFCEIILVINSIVRGAVKIEALNKNIILDAAHFVRAVIQDIKYESNFA